MVDIEYFIWQQISATKKDEGNNFSPQSREEMKLAIAQARASDPVAREIFGMTAEEIANFEWPE